jgi:hypothetical protein
MLNVAHKTEMAVARVTPKSGIDLKKQMSNGPSLLFHNRSL